MRELCLHGKTVIATIHQPRSSIYDMFDQLLILGSGNNVYFGDAQQGNALSNIFLLRLRLNKSPQLLVTLSRLAFLSRHL